MLKRKGKKNRAKAKHVKQYFMCLMHFTIIGLFNIFPNTLTCIGRSTPSKDVKGEKNGKMAKEPKSNRKKN
jgi:hypothetical protein